MFKTIFFNFHKNRLEFHRMEYIQCFCSTLGCCQVSLSISSWQKFSIEKSGGNLKYFRFRNNTEEIASRKSQFALFLSLPEFTQYSTLYRVHRGHKIFLFFCSHFYLIGSIILQITLSSGWWSEVFGNTENQEAQPVSNPFQPAMKVEFCKNNLFRLSFFWLLPLLRLGYHVPLEQVNQLKCGSKKILKWNLKCNSRTIEEQIWN